MSDVFVSYARADEAQAERVADRLRERGYCVWRDDELPAHRAYADVIEERLKSAEAVVVLWSAEAVKSQWVRAEADAARSAGTLAQAAVDGTVPPLPFNQIQCADLSGWSGDTNAPGWRKLTASVEALAGAPKRDSIVPADQSNRGQVCICVLPFSNMSGDAEQEYFSDGISEDITTDLSKVSALVVTARNTAFTFKGRSVQVCDIAKQLGVSHVLEGSVRKAGARVRITAQLIDGNSGGHVWAERYDRDLTNIFAIQDEISKAIVEALKLKLLPEEEKAIEQRGTTNVDAYELFLIARQAWISGSQADSRREEAVIRLCDRILEMEPDYGRAWALKALAQAALHFGYNKGNDNGLAAAERAFELDPSLPEAYSVKARVLAAQRRFEEAEVQIQIALKLAPDSWEVNREGALIYHWAHKFQDAARLFEHCVELAGDDRHSMGMLASTYRALGDQAGLRRTAERYLKAAEAAVAQDPSNSSAFGSGAEALVMLGDIKRAKEWIDRAVLIDPDSLGLRYNFVCSLLNHSDELDLAFEHLHYVFDRSVGAIIRRADLDPDLDRIRDHPRFQEIYANAKERIAKLDAEKSEAVVTPGAT
jgi:adenylate cyclase